MAPPYSLPCSIADRVLTAYTGIKKLSSQEPVLVMLVRTPLEGRDDVARDDDILYFRFNV